jgi:hypothetical protein
MNNRRIIFYFLLAVIFCFAAERSPAPIVEMPENPTPAPAPQQTSAAKEKRSYRTKSQTTTTNKEPRQSSVSSGPARFSGNWSGSITQSIVYGMVPISFFINADATFVKMKEGERPAAINGNTITWNAGWLNEVTWTLTPQGGNSALVTAKSRLGINGTATFTRATTVAAAPPPNQPAVTPKPNAETANLPTARQVPGKPGFVFNPFDPKPGAVFDVRGKDHGTIVRDPATGKLFVLP